MRNRRREDTQAEIRAYRHRTSCQRDRVFPFARSVLLLALIGFLLGSWTALQAASFDDEPQPPRPPLETLSDLPYLPSSNLQLDRREPLEPHQFVAWSRLVFQSMRDNNWEIYSAAGDGSGQTRLTNHPADDIQPRFNRGANRIVFASKRSGNDYEIYSMDANGLDVVQLTNNSADDLAPDWSPNGAKIVFQSHRDGQAEVYVVNANGSNPVRLTSHPGYDGGPVWSPDSSQIAFTSDRDGQNRVWLMRADGSNPTVLAYLPRSQNPAWSPDGSQIALDCDENGDTWQELCLVKLDGTFQHEVYKAPIAQTNVRARSWSPDGRFVAFTEITYVNQAGQWHWTNANLYAWDSINPLSVRRLSSNLDWKPGWQTTDVEAPTAALGSLPAQSPSPIVVHWSGTDSGLAGIRNYAVQVRDGEAGVWMEWLSATTAITGTYPGVGGHTYGFRVRARDNAYNEQPWPAGPQQSTTVEALPPVTAVQPLPHYLRNYWGSVSWGGYDLGGSGIWVYDLQYRRQGDDWTSWLTTPITSSTFLGEAGRTYFFRSTGRDNALNVEDAHPGQGDASTTLYAWAVTGRSFDFRGMPVLGVTAVVTPSAFATLPSTLTAGYASYVADWPETYDVHWPMPGYGDLPPTRFDRSQDALVDVYLPPPDNLVQDWGFEHTTLEPAWQPSGAITPTVSSAFRHTGASAALLGCLPFTQVRSQLASPGSSQSPEAAMDSSGAIHVVWSQATGAGSYGVYYARRAANGSWSAPHNLSNSSGYSSGPQLAVGSDGIVHVIWYGSTASNTGLFYAQRAPSGAWSTPQFVTTGQSPQMAVDNRGIVHLLWRDFGIRYAQRTLNGLWTVPLSLAANGSQPQLAVVADGNVYAFWIQEIGPSSYAPFYAHRSGTTWSHPQQVAGLSLYSPVLSQPRLDGSGMPHLLIYGLESYANAPVYYAKLGAGGSWEKTKIATYHNSPVVEADLVVEINGAVHAAWIGGDSEPSLFYDHKAITGSWSEPQRLVSGIDPREWYEGPFLQLAVDSTGLPHLAWSDKSPDEIFYIQRQAGGSWSQVLNVSNTPLSSWGPQLLINASGIAHVLWSDDGEGVDADIFYANPTASSFGSSHIRQTVSLPAAPSVSTLSFLYQFPGTESASGKRFELRIEDGSTSTALFTTDSLANDWTHRWFDMSPWAGHAVTLDFVVDQRAGQPCSWVELDEVSVGGSYSDVWVAESAATALPGEQVVYTIKYGNRGSALASGVTVTHTLPAEVGFVSANPPPATTSPFLTWEIGDLEARGGPHTIVVTVSLSGSAAMGSHLTGQASIATTSPEMDTSNNSRPISIFVGRTLYLPLLLK